MAPITLVTGNAHKLAELQAIFPADMQLQARSIDTDEIQSLDLHEIVSRKLRQAYTAVGSPVIVEDVSAELANLNGLPGPFIKFFNERLGKESLYKLGGEGPVRAVCCMGYYDGRREIIVDGILEGRVVAPRGEDGFGFDFVFMPNGYDKTLAELGAEVKNTLSHRYKAAQLLLAELTSGQAAAQ